MSPLDIIRAWKDEDYRLSLSNAPESPVGLIELTDLDMGSLAGGGGDYHEHHHGRTGAHGSCNAHNNHKTGRHGSCNAHTYKSCSV